MKNWKSKWLPGKIKVFFLHMENFRYETIPTVLLTLIITLLQGIPLVGCFAAASNVTGVLADTVRISQIVHKNGGLAIFDYATAAPYVKIDMHPPEPNASKGMVLNSNSVVLNERSFIGLPLIAKNVFAE